MKEKLPSHRKHSCSSEGDNDGSLSVTVVKFECHCETIFGQSLFISGSIEEFGSWDPDKALPMTTSPTKYPVWESSIDLVLPVGMTIEYKYLIKEGKTVIEWESLPQVPHRTLTMKKEGNFILYNEKGTLTQKVKQLERKQSSTDLAIDRPKQYKELLKTRKISFESSSSAIVFNQEPIDLISYENNKMNSNVLIDNSFNSIQNLKITNSDKIIIATDYLPIEIIKDENGSFSYRQNVDSSVLATLNHMKLEKNANLLWIGMLPNYFDFNEDEIEQIDEMLQDDEYLMIFPSKEEWEGNKIYLNKIIYPIFIDNTISNENEYLYEYEKYFKFYHAINRRYCEIISVNMQENDFIIINDIALALLPNLIIKKNHNATIGMYIHSPLPGSDIIKAIPRYQDLIRSILLCDVIGFHLNISARNFHTILQRVFGLFFEITKQGLMVVKYFGKTILIHIKQGQVDVNYLKSLTMHKNFVEYEKKFSLLIGKKFSIISFDHLNLVHALATKFIAFENFLRTSPQRASEVIFIVIIQSFDVIKEEDKQNGICSFIQKRVNGIQNEFHNNNLFHIKYVCSFNIYERLALFKKCNVILYPQYFTGHCIYANEFIAMKSKKEKYFLILGESICANAGIKSAMKSNPFNSHQLSQLIGKCFNTNFSKEQMAKRFAIDIEFVKENSTMKWVRLFLSDMKRIKAHDSKNKIGMGIGLNFKLLTMNDRFRHLSTRHIKKYYSRANKRILFLDYENTLVEIDESESLLKEQNEIYPNQRILKILKCLSKDQNNLIFILSKYDSEFISKCFVPLSTSIGLCSENGFYYKYPGEIKFSELNEITDWSWRDTVMKILNSFTEKTEGSYIVSKKSCISWVYKYCDNLLARIQSNEIKTHLVSIFNNKLDIVNDGECVDIKPKNVNKAAFIAKILQMELQKEKTDFILAFGDDGTDEEMFKYLNSAEKFFGNFNDKIKVITGTIGKKPSEAKYFLNEVNECIEYLEMMGHLEREKRHRTNSSKEGMLLSFVPSKKKYSFNNEDSDGI